MLLKQDLRQWAGDQVASSGRNYALLGRVQALRIAPDGSAVHARVRGNRPVPHTVEVVVTRDGLRSVCSCSRREGAACRHAVAALEALRFPLPTPEEQDAQAKRRRHAGRRARGQGRIIQQARLQPGFVVLGSEERTLTKDERLKMATETEVGDRRERARRERATVKPLAADGLPPRFRVGRRGSQGPYLVTLRGERYEIGTCTCPDFEKNELGTCKHVERARNWYVRKKKTTLDGHLSVWWEPRAWIERGPDALQEIRARSSAGELPASLGRYFDESGRIRAAPPGQTSTGWIRSAIEEAGRTARDDGVRLDLDPSIEARLAAIDAEEKRSGHLSRLDGDLWRDLEPRLGLRLHPYQVEGVRFLAERGRAFLADDMGLGKTVQAVAAALMLRRGVDARKCLVVCPASLKHQWKEEILKVCGEQAVVIEGRRSLREDAYASWNGGFLVLNYEIVLRDLDLIRDASADLVILDEAQRIKNWDTKTAKAAKELDSPHAFVLTGTPLENRLSELHSLVEFLYPRALGPRWRLLPYHAVADPQGRVVAYEDLDILRRRLEPFFLRREREMVLDQLPEKTVNTFWTGMTATQWRPYRRHAAKVARLLSRGKVLAANDVRVLLQSLTSMRILCNAYAQHAWDRFSDQVLRGFPEAPSDIRRLQSPKLEEFADVMEELLEESEAKVVVFSQWERMLRLAHYVLLPLLRRRGESGDVFHGGLNGRSRVRMLDRFRDDPDFRILLSTDAGGLGLNLQDAASIVINLEVPWNPAVLEQRIGRVHRIGQRQSVQVLHFVTRGALEERVLRVVEGKRALFEGLLVEGADRVTLTADGRATFAEQVRNLIADDGGSRG
jgi:superfamily II DNA or RNA helicase